MDPLESYFEIGLWIGTRSKERNHKIIEEIISNKDSIERHLGKSLIFWNNENNKATSVNLRYDKEVGILTMSEAKKEDLINWIVEWMQEFKEVLYPIIKLI